jgi:hypothetical protein
MPKSKISALLSLLLVFASGVLVGAVGYRLYTVSSVATATLPKSGPPRLDPEEARRRLIADQRQRLHLDDQQVAQLNQIYDETRQAFDQLHREGSAKSRAIWDRQKAKVRAILRPDQVPLYDQWQAERDAMHKRERDRDRDHHRPPPPDGGGR